MAPLSIFIIAKNEGDRIGRTLAALASLADEIIVVDSGSADDTVAVAEGHGARVLHHPFLGFGPQKQFAEEQCRNDWLLNLDADEVIDTRLRRSIEALFQDGEPKAPLHRIRIETVYPGEEKPRPFADALTPVRLYDRRVARYSASLTDDRVLDGGRLAAVLPGRVHHFSFRSFAHIRDKLADYADLQTIEKAGRRDPALLRLRLVGELPFQFAKYWLVRRHVFGGRAGFRYALEHARAKKRRVARFLAARTAPHESPEAGADAAGRLGNGQPDGA